MCLYLVWMVDNGNVIGRLTRAAISGAGDNGDDGKGESKGARKLLSLFSFRVALKWKIIGAREGEPLGDLRELTVFYKDNENLWYEKH